LAKEMPAAAPLKIVDVGTGSGNIAIAIAKHLPAAAVMAVDTSAGALGLARRNAERHRVLDRVQFIESDLLAALPEDQSWDFVVSNPPYVSESEYETVPREVKDYEPRSALVAGSRGTEVIERLIDQGARLLRAGGWLLFEISPMIAAACRDLLEQKSTWSDVKVINDLSGQARITQARRA
jgi:release factor glutamine methyltransferase